MAQDSFFLRNLARAFLAGAWSRSALLARGGEACGRRFPWLTGVVRRVLLTFPSADHLPSEDQLLTYLAELLHPGHRHGGETPHRIFWVNPRMAPAKEIPCGELPALRTAVEVAAWLGVTPEELDWFAAPPWRAKAASSTGGHYIYRWHRKQSGRPRLIEASRPRLKAVQRRILHDLLDRIPAHESAHGFRAGRSILSYAAPHSGREIVLRFDLRDFFPSIPLSRVHALFRRVGYPCDVARILTRLCTNTTSETAWATKLGSASTATNRRLYERPHLPQGSPTSPALANLCAFRLDCRLAALAQKIGARYTRYADDLAFSGDARLARSVRRLHVLVCRIALEEGFEVHTRKTRFMRQGVRQQLAGLVLNVRPNIRRADYDRLKATLTNCLRHGPASQNRAGNEDFRAHLLGCIAHVAHVHADRGRKLRMMFDRISWGDGQVTEADPSNTTR